MSVKRFLRKKIIVFILLILISPVFSISVDFEQTIPIQIQVNIEWEHPPKSGNTRSIGAFMLQVTGNARLIEEDGEFLRYEPVDMQAFARIKDEDIMEINASKHCSDSISYDISACSGCHVSVGCKQRT